jgi:hypothetical protein
VLVPQGRGRCPKPVLVYTRGRHPPDDPKLQDRHGFTLAATCSEFIYATALGNNGAPSPQPCEPRKTRPVVWLIVLRGSNTLERVAHEFEQWGISNIPDHVLTRIMKHVGVTGTWIAEADGTDDDIDISAPIRARVVHPGKIDYPLLRSWFDFCAKSHPSCAPSSTSGAVVPHMKLIDCKTRTLVAAEPHMRYLALSYVWGNGPPEASTYPSLPTTLPPTVEDSLVVTLGLGLRYIWVDRYCIRQDDSTHKSTQILHMAQIYGNATATLAAACGTGPTHGLPGASPTARHRTRNHQIIGRVGRGRTLASGPFPHLQEKLTVSSVWDSRAWTFQEAALSRRILFFSDIQVSFQCAKCARFEHLSRPLALGSGIFDANYKSTYLDTKADCINELVRCYSKRKMTFASDAFNAFAGVLGAWGKNPGCFHYWGFRSSFRPSVWRKEWAAATPPIGLSAVYGVKPPDRNGLGRPG